MKYLKKFAVPLIIILLDLLLVKTFRVIPASKLWNGYSVFYIKSDAKPEYVENILEQYGCKDFISLNRQLVPLNVPLNSVERNLAEIDNSSDSYLNSRKNYFFDKSGEYSVYYIPEGYDGELQFALKHFNNDGFSAGVNADSAYPWIAFVITLVFVIILVCFSDKKNLTVIVSFFPVYFLFMMPFYSVAAGLCLLLSGVFFAQRYWKRQGALICCRKNMLVYLPVSMSIVICGFTNLLMFPLMFLTLISMISVAYLYDEIHEISENKYSFHPVPICSARMIPVITKRNRYVLPLCLSATFIILLAGIFSLKNINFTNSRESSGLMLPSGTAEKKSLPDLNDYVVWNWNAVTFPYRSLNSEYKKQPENGDRISFTRFFERNGIIETSLNTLCFDNDFRNQAINSIDNFDYVSIEKLLKKQGNFIKPGYSSTGGSSLSFFGIILMISAVIVSGFFYLRFFKSKKNRRNS